MVGKNIAHGFFLGLTYSAGSWPARTFRGRGTLTAARRRNGPLYYPLSKRSDGGIRGGRNPSYRRTDGPLQRIAGAPRRYFDCDFGGGKTYGRAARQDRGLSHEGRAGGSLPSLPSPTEN